MIAHSLDVGLSDNVLSQVRSKRDVNRSQPTQQGMVTKQRDSSTNTNNIWLAATSSLGNAEIHQISVVQCLAVNLSLPLSHAKHGIEGPCHVGKALELEHILRAHFSGCCRCPSCTWGASSCHNPRLSSNKLESQVWEVILGSVDANIAYGRGSEKKQVVPHLRKKKRMQAWG